VYGSTQIDYVWFLDKNLRILDNEAYTNKGYRTKDVLNPGTYYVRITNAMVFNTYATVAKTIWWK
jgi:hypothetical protein